MTKSNSLSNKGFIPPGQESASRSELRNRRRDKNESVTDYGYALRRLGCLAFPGIPYDAKEIYITDKFIYGLGSQEIKKHVTFHHLKTLDETISLAVEFESFDGSQSTLNKPKVYEQINTVHAVQKSNKPGSTNMQNNPLELLSKQISEKFTKLTHTLRSNKTLKTLK